MTQDLSFIFEFFQQIPSQTRSVCSFTSLLALDLLLVSSYDLDSGWTREINQSVVELVRSLTLIALHFNLVVRRVSL